MATGKRTHYCDFCFKSNLEVEFMATSEDATICNECVDACATLFASKRESKPVTTDTTAA